MTQTDYGARFNWINIISGMKTNIALPVICLAAVSAFGGIKDAYTGRFNLGRYKNFCTLHVQVARMFSPRSGGHFTFMDPA